MPHFRFLILLLLPLMISCIPQGLEESSGDYTETASLPKTKGSAALLNQSEFDALTPIEQYQVANKLLGTLYKGIPASEFFDMSAGFNKPRVKPNGEFLAKTAHALSNKLLDIDAYAGQMSERYVFDEARRATAEPLAFMYELPLSRDLLEAWMAYVLSNTILFSPAEEIDSAGYTDVKNVYDGLYSAMGKDTSIRSIVLTHMESEANWRRFRSPEDNTREMIEIYLGLFDKDEDVPKASIACKNWYITDDGDGYQLIKDAYKKNIEPQKVLGQWVTSCEDFYKMIAGHALLIPRITTVLVDHFFPKASSALRASVVQSVVASNPTRFHDIFLGIIFSREYLFNNEKPKNLEETFFNIAHRIYWKPHTRFFRDLTNPDPGSTYPTLHKIGQPAMSLKLGRWKDQPLDSLSFAYFHEAIRERLLLDRVVNEFDVNDAGWRAGFIENGDILQKQDFVDYLFISVAGRRATTEEQTTLAKIFVDNGDEENRLDQALVVLDYLSRLPEIYFLNAKN